MKSVNIALAVIGTAMVDGEEAGIVMADHALHHRLVSPEDLQGGWDVSPTTRVWSRRVGRLHRPSP
jgi:hypothetical protein